MKYKSGPICFACVNAQEFCPDCRETDYRRPITRNFECEGIPFRSRRDIEDDTFTTSRSIASEIALKATSRLQVIQAQQKGIEEANKKKEEAKAKKAEMARLYAKQVEDLYRSRIIFPSEEEKSFNFATALKKTWTKPPHIPSLLDELSAGSEEIKKFQITSSLYPDHAWTINARTEYDARLWVARYMKISFSETQIV